MKREIVYCDKCREQMTVFDADGDQQLNGYVFRGRQSDSRVSLDIHEKTSTGSSSASGELIGTHFCSDACLILSMEEFLKHTKITLILPEHAGGV